VQFITPIRERASAIYYDEAYLKQVIEEGAEKAKQSAQKTIAIVREFTGFTYY
ncbi:MAG: tryptophan--tRNA ligase, partial [Flavisolibacter sp.]|nr:tryptophan--tRNA ligase [Flavisolibacter sp.]